MAVAEKDIIAKTERNPLSAGQTVKRVPNAVQLEDGQRLSHNKNEIVIVKETESKETADILHQRQQCPAAERPLCRQVRLQLDPVQIKCKYLLASNCQPEGPLYVQCLQKSPLVAPPRYKQS